MATENPYTAPTAKIADSNSGLKETLKNGHHLQEDRTRRIAKIAGFMLIGFFVAWVLNIVLCILFMPDPCHYHAREEEAGIIFNLLFDFKASEGFHPTHSLLHKILTSALGALGGLIFGIKRRK